MIFHLFFFIDIFLNRDILHNIHFTLYMPTRLKLYIDDIKYKQQFIIQIHIAQYPHSSILNYHVNFLKMYNDFIYLYKIEFKLKKIADNIQPFVILVKNCTHTEYEVI